MKRRKECRNIYDDAITMDHLFKMWKIIKGTCKNKKELYYFSLNLNSNLYQIYNSLKKETYLPSKYRTFIIFEPKPRLVMSQTITDKIVNHFVANYYLIPYLESSLIDSNVATRKNKGGNYAIGLMKKYFNKLLINYPNQEIYCLKMDISKYFYSIDHDVLIDMVEKKIKDKKVIHLLRVMINETNASYINKNIDYYNQKYNINIPHYQYNVGLSIGAMANQFLAIFFLNDIDHYIKEELGCKYYIRYMDDLLILDLDKERLKKIFQLLVVRFSDIHLKVNRKSNIYRCSNGVHFLGYKYLVSHGKLLISCNKKTVFRIKKKLNYLSEVDRLSYLRSLASYRGYFMAVYHLPKRRYCFDFYYLYSSYKLKYPDRVIIVYDKGIYRSYWEDVIIFNHIFHKKFVDCVVFNRHLYDAILKHLVLYSFMVVSRERVMLEYSKEV